MKAMPRDSSNLGGHPQQQEEPRSVPATTLQEQWTKWVETFFLPMVMMGRGDAVKTKKKHPNSQGCDHNGGDHDIDDDSPSVIGSTDDDSGSHYDGESYSHSYYTWNCDHDDDDDTMTLQGVDDNPMMNYELDQLQLDMDMTQRHIGHLKSEFQEDLMELSVRLEDAFQRFDDESFDVMMQIQQAQVMSQSTTRSNLIEGEPSMRTRIKNRNKRSISSCDSLRLELAEAEIGKLRVYEEDDDIQTWFDKVWSTTETVFLERMQCGGGKTQKQAAAQKPEKTLYQRWKQAWWRE